VKNEPQSLKADQRRLLALIGNAARNCRTVEEEFRRCPAPALETLIQLHRSLAMNLAAEGKAGSGAERIQLLTSLVRTTLEFARLEEKRADRTLAETKHRESLQTKLEAGLEAVADCMKGHPVALQFFRQAEAVLKGEPPPESSK
jgi:hypothetical protein